VFPIKQFNRWKKHLPNARFVNLYGPTEATGMSCYYEINREFEPDAATHTTFTSGRANELAGSTMIDWPGRPGTRVPDFSTHQVIEQEYMSQEEYPEFLGDYTGFMFRKYIPRAFPALKGLKNINFVPSIVLSTNPLASLYSPEAREAFSLLNQIGEEDNKAAEASMAVTNKLIEMGYPPFSTGVGEAPFDILGDYYRGTLGALADQLECPDQIEAACDMLADIQIKSYAYLRTADLPVKRIFFPLHKGMDGFMNPKQYEKLYWKPLKKVMMALIDMGVTPHIYTEGKYNTRIETLADVPRGKVIYHFETADMAKAKKVLGDVACISGNLPIQLLEFGTKQQVIDSCKELIDTCAPGGGYIFDTNGCIDNAKRENLEAMFDTVRTYGKK
jgi:uroporphyrinogen-III decarboxylase